MFRRQVFYNALLILLVLAVGTAGYGLIEGWGFLDSLYMTVITITTVGYKEVHPLNGPGRIFTMVLIFFGLGIILYILNTGARIIIEGEFARVLGRRKLEKRIRKLKGHYIICGYGRMGRIISKEFQASGTGFVVIEKEPPPAELGGVLFIQGDATRDETLREAGIEYAAGLVSVLPTDAENLYVVLTAKGLNPQLVVVARAGEDGSEQKLLRAGADKVVSPYYIGGLRIAHTILRPAVVDFIEFATKTGNLALQMEEVVIAPDSGLVGRTLDECGLGRDLGVIIVGMKGSRNEMEFNPTSQSVLRAGNVLIALGESSKLKKLEEMAGGGGL
ncbi:MAG: potassium channel protein [Nitrospiraceae bacterium]|nr:potassium channel protein [Nitrospiraceae bacterium]